MQTRAANCALEVDLTQLEEEAHNPFSSFLPDSGNRVMTFCLVLVQSRGDNT